MNGQMREADEAIGGDAADARLKRELQPLPVCVTVPALLMTLSVWLFGSIALGLIRENYFGADDLYLPTLLEDILYWHGSLDAWRLTPAPYLLPDLLLYAPSRVISGSVEFGLYISGLAQLLLFVWGSVRLMNITGSAVGLARVLIGVVLLAICALSMSAISDFALFGNLYRITNHGGAALLTVATLNFCLGDCENRVTRTILLSVAAGLGGMSDPLYAASCGIPLLVVGICLAAQPRTRLLLANLDRAALQRVSLRMSIVGASSLGGAAMTDALHSLLNPLPKLTLAPSKLTTLARMFNDFTSTASGRGLWLVAGLVTSLSILVTVRSHSASRLRIVALWHAVSLAVTAVAMCGTQLYLDAGAQRYLVVPSVFTPLLATAGASLWLRQHLPSTLQPRLVLFGSWVIVVILAISTTGLLPSLATASYSSAWRRRAGCVAQVLRNENVDVLLTDYWRAKPLMLFSDGDVHTIQMRAKLKRPYFWISSRDWSRGTFRFGAVAVNDLDPAAIELRFGAPASIHQCDGVTLYAYRGEQRQRLSKHTEQVIARFLRDPHPP